MRLGQKSRGEKLSVSRDPSRLRPFCAIAACCILLALNVTTVCASAASNATTKKHAATKRSHGPLVQTGIDVLEAQKFAPLRGKHVGLITNHTGLDAQGRTTAELL